MDDEQLERRLFAPPPPPSAKRPLPDWPVVYQELRRKDASETRPLGALVAGAPDTFLR